MTSCAPNAQVTLTVTLLGGGGANGALTCTQEVFTSVTLNYSACTSDPWASGGIFAAVTQADTSGNPTAGIIACACVPAYLDGPGASLASTSQLLGGVVVGARSDLSGPSQQQCPSPTAGNPTHSGA